MTIAQSRVKLPGKTDMISKPQQTLELEAELMRLNALVRERRQQMARLDDCPNPECPCRVVWKDKVEKGLASQMRKIGKQVKGPCDCASPKTKRKQAPAAKRKD